MKVHQLIILKVGGINPSISQGLGSNAAKYVEPTSGNFMVKPVIPKTGAEQLSSKAASEIMVNVKRSLHTKLLIRKDQALIMAEVDLVNPVGKREWRLKDVQADLENFVVKGRHGGEVTAAIFVPTND